MTECAEPPVALVTGSNPGVGLEAVRCLVTAGFRVYLGARSSERGQPAADEEGAQFDVTEESVIRAAATVELADGHLDVLVNNAGITGPLRDAIRDYTAEEATAGLMTNVVGYVRMIHAFLPRLERATDHHIINVSSGPGSLPSSMIWTRSSRTPALPYARHPKRRSIRSPRGMRGCCPTFGSTSPTPA